MWRLLGTHKGTTAVMEGNLGEVMELGSWMAVKTDAKTEGRMKGYRGWR